MDKTRLFMAIGSTVWSFVMIAIVIAGFIGFCILLVCWPMITGLSLLGFSAILMTIFKYNELKKEGK